MQDDHGLDVNLLLWCLWCARNYDAPPEFVIRKAVDMTRRWSTDITATIRSVRRALKEPPAQASDVAAQELRESLEDAELMAEKIEQDMLEAIANANLARPSEASGAAARARKTLASYVRMSGAAKTAGFSVSLLETLIEHTFPGSESDGSCVG